MTISNFISGWESGDDAWTADSLDKGASYKYCGDYGARAFLAGAGTDYATNHDSTGCANGQYIYARLMFKLPALPAVGEYVGLYRVRDGNTDDIIEVGIECSAGPVYDIKLTVEHSGGGPYTATINPVANTWYCLQVQLYYSNTGFVYVDFDDSREITQTAIDTRDDTWDAEYMDVGVINATSAIQAYIDDCEFDPTSMPGCISLPGAVTNVFASTTFSDRVDITWTAASGATGYYVFRDGGLISTKGAVTFHNDYGATAPTIIPGTAIASDGTYVPHVRLALGGETIIDGFSHSYDIIPFNSCGEGPSDSDSGYRSKSTLNYQWRRSAADSDASFSDIVGGTTDPYNDIGAPANGDGRWYYCRLSSSGASSQDSTHNRGYRNVPSVSMVGGPTGWVWQDAVAGNVVRVTTDGGLTWAWTVAAGTQTIPVGGPTGWTWTSVTF